MNMNSIEKTLDKHQGLTSALAALLVAAVSLTAFAYTTFATKDEVKQRAAEMETNHLEQNAALQRQIQDLKDSQEKRFDRLESKLDHKQ
jgi:cell division protein FtsL